MPDSNRIGSRIAYVVGSVLLGVVLWVALTTVLSRLISQPMPYAYTTGILIPSTIVATVPPSTIFDSVSWRNDTGVSGIVGQLLLLLVVGTIGGLLTTVALQNLGIAGPTLVIPPIIAGFVFGYIVFLRINRRFVDRDSLSEQSSFSV